MKLLGIPPSDNDFYVFTEDLFAPDCIFVFGSNTAGVHGAGAAKAARFQYGAQLGVGMGFTGRAYGIPTKDANIRTLPLETIRIYVEDFVKLSRRGGVNFLVAAVGCKLAGYTPAQIAPLFRGAKHCWFPMEWKPYLT